MFSLLKPVRLKRYLLLPLLAALLLAGCSQAQPDSAGGGPVTPPAGSQAAQSPRPEGTAIPSAPADGMAASTSGAAPAGAEAGAADAPPPAAPGGAGTGSAPSSAAGVTDTPAPVPAAAAPASAGKPAQTPAGTKQPAAAASSAAAPRPPATAAPAGTKQPAAAVSSAPVPRPPATTAPVNAVTLSITGDKEHGVILAPAAYEIEKNETALELLKRITRKHKIQMEYQGSKAFAYVEGIDNLYEYDHGAESGWMYRVNGEFPSAASGSWIVKPGDTIEWLYTLDLGKDLGAAKP